MKEKMSLNRNRDRDITARQPLLDEQQNEKNISLTNNNNSTATSVVGGVLGNSVSGNIASTIAGTMASRHSGTKYSKLENTLDSPGHYATLDSPGHKFVGETVSIQQRMMQGQDEQLDMISDSIGTLKTVSRQIGVELDEQAVMLDDFGNEFDTTESKLDSTMKKVAKVLHMNNDKRQWAAIIFLSSLLIIVILLFIIL
ncbi:syntaxin-6 isoform X2 [Eupeodes corollae]|nr:syntaxin-6 isoform X2 [Eupeodes corollae]XP_055920080.1 syntaxin-6 isoform X2 [Eupeodes corollae]